MDLMPIIRGMIVGSVKDFICKLGNQKFRGIKIEKRMRNLPREELKLKDR